jgi:hypothetical protein
MVHDACTIQALENNEMALTLLEDAQKPKSRMTNWQLMKREQDMRTKKNN